MYSGVLTVPLVIVVYALYCITVVLVGVRGQLECMLSYECTAIVLYH